MSKRSFQHGNGNRGRRRGRDKRVLVPMINDYREKLGQSDMKTFNDGLRAYRLARQQTGPGRRTTEQVLNTGYASAEMADTILAYLREQLQEAYADKYLTPEDAPMIVRLDEWPQRHSMASVTGVARGCGLLLRPESIAELASTIMNSDKAYVLHASVGGGFAVKDLMNALKKSDSRKVKQIVVRRISDKYAASLVKLKLLPKDFCETLKRNIEWLQSESDRLGMEDVEVVDWKDRPLLHGMKYGNIVLYHAPWEVCFEGLSTVEGWLRRLTPDGDTDFQRYSDLFEKGA